MSEMPRWFRPIAIVALLWNLLGCAAYLMDVNITPEQVSQLTPEQQAMHASRPGWAVGATAIAVWFGAAGCVGLVMRKRWASWLLVASLIGVIAQDVWLFMLSGSAQTGGPAVLVLQGLVLVISIGLVLLARRASAEGWLS